MDEGMEIADSLLARWDETRRDAIDRQHADASFRTWLMHTVPREQAAFGRPPEEDVEAHCYSVFSTVTRCEQLGRFADGLMLVGWLAEYYVPAGDDVAARTVMACSDACLVASGDPALFAPAVELLRWIIATTRGRADPRLLPATNHALMNFAGIHRTRTTVETYADRTQVAIAAYGEVIDSWHTTSDPAVAPEVASALMQRGVTQIELGDETAARADFNQVVDWFGAVEGLRPHLEVARHALDVMATVTFPDPQFSTAYLEAQQRRDLREGRQGFAEEHLAVARRRHTATGAAVRRFTCWGQPVVLLLRNFDLVEWSTVTTSPLLQEFDDGEPETHVQTMSAIAGVPLINRLDQSAHVVHVASTVAAGLELDWYSEPWRPSMTLPLYLPADDWRDSVRLLIGIAERIVVWANSKTAGLADELAMLTAGGRAADTVVLLEQEPQANPFIAAMLGDAPPQGDPLAADDPLLAGFPTVMRVDEVLPDDVDSSPFLRTVLEPVYAAGQLPLAERAARVRGRIETTRMTR